MNLLADVLIVDRAGDFNALFSIARHKVSRSDIHTLVISLTEAIHAGVFEEATDDGNDLNILGFLRDIGQNAADTAHDHTHTHAGARGLFEFLNQVDIGDGVHLNEDAALAELGDLAVDLTDDASFERGRCDHQVLVLTGHIADGEVLEEVVCILTDGRIGCNERQVGILQSGLFIIVTRADLGDILHAALAAAGNQADFRVHFRCV